MHKFYVKNPLIYLRFFITILVWLFSYLICPIWICPIPTDSIFIKSIFLIINDRVPIKLFSARFIGFFHDAYITFIFTEIIGARIWFVRLWLVITDYPIFFVIKSVEINHREKNVNFAALDIWSDNFIIMDLFTFEICDMHPKTVSR